MQYDTHYYRLLVRRGLPLDFTGDGHAAEQFDFINAGENPREEIIPFNGVMGLDLDA